MPVFHPDTPITPVLTGEREMLRVDSPADDPVFSQVFAGCPPDPYLGQAMWCRTARTLRDNEPDKLAAMSPAAQRRVRELALQADQFGHH